jgi:hypothetical protein
MAASIIIATLFLIGPAFAQTTPALHSRGHNDQQASPTQAAKGVSTLPENASGEFTLDSHGSVIQITIEHNRLDGYITLMQQDTSLTLFFNKTFINGKRVTFTTRIVHGLSYSFAGEILRGDAEAPSLNGYYRLAGKITSYRDGVAETKWVNLKSTPRLEGKD